MDDAGAYTAVASGGIDTLVSVPATLEVDLCRALDQWTKHAPPPGSNALNGIACASDLLMAVGDAGSILRSADGVSWFASPSGTNVMLNAVTRGDGVLVAVGPGGYIATSPDGANWTPHTSGIVYTLYDVTHGNGTILLSGFTVAPRLHGRGADDGFELDLTSEIGMNYRVQTSPILPATQWLDLFRFTNSWPWTTLRDPTATNAPQRFYRVVSP